MEGRKTGKHQRGNIYCTGGQESWQGQTQIQTQTQSRPNPREQLVYNGGEKRRKHESKMGRVHQKRFSCWRCEAQITKFEEYKDGRKVNQHEGKHRGAANGTRQNDRERQRTRGHKVSRSSSRKKEKTKGSHTALFFSVCKKNVNRVICNGKAFDSLCSEAKAQVLPEALREGAQDQDLGQAKQLNTRSLFLLEALHKGGDSAGKSSWSRSKLPRRRQLRKRRAICSS